VGSGEAAAGGAGGGVGAANYRQATSQIVQAGPTSKGYPRARHVYRLNQILARERERYLIRDPFRAGGDFANPIVRPELPQV
jgi:hypothetical protein